MGTTQIATMAKDTWESLKVLLEKTEERIREEVDHATPVVQKGVGGSIDAAMRGFDSTMKGISSHTEREQLELLNAYRRFLAGQIEFVDSRLKELDQRTHGQKAEVSHEEAWKAAQRAFWFPANADV